MSTSSSAYKGRQLGSWSACLLGLGSEVALSATLILLALSHNIRESQRSILIAGIAFNIVSLLLFAAVSTLLLLQLHERLRIAPARRWMICGLFVLVCLVAISLIVVSLSLISSQLPTKKRQPLDALLAAGFALCIINVIAVTTFVYTTFSPPRLVQEIVTATDNGGSITTASELKDSPNMKSSRDLFPEDHRVQSPTSGFYDAPPRRASIRNSVQNFLQPMNSKSRLVHHASFQSGTTAYTDRRDSFGHRIEDGFDTWEVELEGSPIESPAAYVGTRLDPIPASRPVSPAKPLDGPFPDAMIPEEDSSPSPVELPASTERSSSVAANSIHSATRSRYSPPRSRSTEHIRTTSLGRRPSTSDEQSHIHPLFRTDSPNPPPTVSPGTIVMASPWAGQVISSPEEAWTLTRTGSRATMNNRPESPSMGTYGPRPGSASGGRPVRPPLRTVRSEEPVMGGLVRANMPPKVYMGVMQRQNSIV